MREEMREEHLQMRQELEKQQKLISDLKGELTELKSEQEMEKAVLAAITPVVSSTPVLPLSPSAVLPVLPLPPLLCCLCCQCYLSPLSRAAHLNTETIGKGRKR